MTASLGVTGSLRSEIWSLGAGVWALELFKYAQAAFISTFSTFFSVFCFFVIYVISGNFNAFFLAPSKVRAHPLSGAGADGRRQQLLCIIIFIENLFPSSFSARNIKKFECPLNWVTVTSRRCMRKGAGRAQRGPRLGKQFWHLIASSCA